MECRRSYENRNSGNDGRRFCDKEFVANHYVGGRLPDRWEDFITHNTLIKVPGLALKGILPCKTFLDPQFESHFSDSRLKEVIAAWPPRSLCDNEEIAAVVSLCLTERFYSSADVEAHGTQYYWFSTDGGGVAPPLATVYAFLELFAVLSARHAGKIVVIHCTHGINRTGLFSAMLLMAFGGLHYKAAVKQFAEARGHPIDRENLVDVLRDLEKLVFADTSFVEYRAYLIDMATRDPMKVSPKAVLKGVPPATHLGKFFVYLLKKFYAGWFRRHPTQKAPRYPLGILCMQFNEEEKQQGLIGTLRFTDPEARDAFVRTWPMFWKHPFLKSVDVKEE